VPDRKSLLFTMLLSSFMGQAKGLLVWRNEVPGFASVRGKFHYFS
jgi:hypothetical protein